MYGNRAPVQDEDEVLTDAPESDDSAPTREPRIYRPFPIPATLITAYPGKDWHEKDPVLRRFDFFELQTQGLAFGPFWEGHSSLTGNIHPLFQDIIDVPGTEPALLLATKLLTERALLPFWHSLIFGAMEPLEGETRAIGRPCRQINLLKKPLLPFEADNTNAALIRIAKSVRITSHKSSHFGDKWAFTKRTAIRIKASEEELGTESNIAFTPKILELLDPVADTPIDQRLRLTFMLAVTLCHEFAHAVHMYRVPPWYISPLQSVDKIDEVEPFIGKDRLPELGIAWESIIFGGRISSLGCREDCLYGLSITKWPGSSTEHLIKMDTADVTVPVKRLNSATPRWDTTYVVPMDYIIKILDQRFWSREIKEKGVGVLRMPKEFGYRKQNYHWTDDGLGDGYATDDSERGRNPDMEMIVRPGQSPLPSPQMPNWDEPESDDTNSDSSSDPFASDDDEYFYEDDDDFVDEDDDDFVDEDEEDGYGGYGNLNGPGAFIFPDPLAPHP